MAYMYEKDNKINIVVDAIEQKPVETPDVVIEKVKGETPEQDKIKVTVGNQVIEG